MQTRLGRALGALLIPYVVGGGAVGDGVPRIRWRRVPLPARAGVAPAGSAP